MRHVIAVKRYFVLVCCLVSVSWLWAQPVTARLELSKSELTIGERTELRLLWSYPPHTVPVGVALEPLLKFGEGNVEVTATHASPDTASRAPLYLLEQRFAVQPFDSGAYTLPAVEVYYRNATGGMDTLRTNQPTLRVRALPVNEETTLQPIKDIEEEPITWRDFLPYALGLLLLVLIPLGVWWLGQRRKPRLAAPAPPPPPPHQTALRKLAELAGKHPREPHEVKGYYSELTYILREYLEQQFGFPALEYTSYETEKALRQLPALAGWQDQLNTLLRQADLVKFAKATPVLDHVANLAMVRDFVADASTYPQPEIEPPNHSSDSP